MNENIKYKFKLNSFTQIDFNQDIFGSQLFMLIKKNFIETISEFIPEKIIMRKKNKNRICENLFSHWFFWEAYNTNSYYHPLLLETKFNYISLKNILSDYLNNDNEIIENKINLIITKINLEDKFTNALNLFKTDKNFTCTFKVYKYDKYKKIYINSNLLNDSFIISNQNSTKKLNKLSEKDFVALMYRYYVLSSNNNQLAVNPEKFKIITPDIELFSSGFNNTCLKYCSLFPDIEHKLGSLGRFQDIEIYSGKYQINPPFQTCIIYDVLKKIKIWIDNANVLNNKLEFHLFLPNWLNDKKNLDLKYSKYLVLDLIKDIKGTVKIKNINNTNFNYIDYWSDKIKNHTLPDTLYITINNKKIEY
ncbi:hypothetical protein crov062 [Cafeteria roenbergensis virus]|uniref:PCIF1 WW domain-containing protein n=1 Tax=Cafeteria roenbergensis virus (strain BV-PW1) TaxID=693272 RepID=E3T4I2_CROVB|nr:hypothetical protein crov062 [Cafeteria roenbergensis virus BV-PW1]ADO67095.1 hypothetical protein crov062 [Cafeteria roenbergensis virus BV-PW1]